MPRQNEISLADSEEVALVNRYPSCISAVQRYRLVGEQYVSEQEKRRAIRRATKQSAMNVGFLFLVSEIRTLLLSFEYFETVVDRAESAKQRPFTL